VEALLSEDAFEEPFRELLTAVREWGIVHGTVSSERSVEGGAFRVRLVASGPEEIFPLMKRVGPLGGVVLFGRLIVVLGRGHEAHFPVIASGSSGAFRDFPPDKMCSSR
jgi:hypothetical protein